MELADKFRNISLYTLGSVFLVANAFIWYFLAARILEEIINNTATNSFEVLIMWSLHFGSLAISAIGGAFLSRKIGRRNLFVVWTMLGALSPFALLSLGFSQMPIVLLTSFLFGVSLGLGMPNCMEYFTRMSTTENRGRYGGMIMLISGLGLASLGMVGVENIEVSVSILVVWRLLGFVILLLPNYQRDISEKSQHVYSFIFNQRSFILYLIPWLMFSLVNYLSIPVQSSIPGLPVKFLMLVESAIIGVFAIVGGFFSDYVGRKRTAIAGFVLLGLGFSVLGLYPGEPASWYFYTVVDGVAWGILYVIFVICVWGDLSYESPSDKYYAIGVLPYFISKFLQLNLGSYVADNVSHYALFSFTAFFLFLAILPLIYAPETLPEKTMKDRELKNYIDKAQKEVEKVQKKEDENAPKENTDPEVEFEGEDFEEKLKEAEKYY